MKKHLQIICLLILVICVVVFLSPLLFVFTGSLMGEKEFASTYGNLSLRFPQFVPRFATISQYVALLLNTPNFLISYWNSLVIGIAVCSLQLVVAVPCAYGLSKLHFHGRRFLLFLFAVMMMMPFQVTMLPMFQLVKEFGLLDSRWALIIPEIFAPFTVFFLSQFIEQLPNELIEAVRLESSSAIVMYRTLVIPLCKPGIVAAMVLSFVETWNMVEKPLLYLSDWRTYPLSMLLSEARNHASATTMAGCVLYLVPIFLLWNCFKDDVCNGIAQLQIK